MLVFGVVFRRSSGDSFRKSFAKVLSFPERKMPVHAVRYSVKTLLQIAAVWSLLLQPREHSLVVGANSRQRHPTFEFSSPPAP